MSSPRKPKKGFGAEKIAQKSQEVILATDEDREGEAISWHLSDNSQAQKRPSKKNCFS